MKQHWKQRALQQQSGLFPFCRNTTLMCTPLPSKQDCFYIITMIETGLIDYLSIHSWAEMLIAQRSEAPAWLCDLAIKTYYDDLLRALGDYVYGEQPEAPPTDLEKFAIGCLWLRYERRELSWATFLRMAGEKLDCTNGDWDCETPYHYLNIYEDAYFSPAAEESTQADYFKDHDVIPWIQEARSRFTPFLHLRQKRSAV